ncbi:MAG: hypothetical protein HY242_12585 [Afipia sp.]|nr:hypothetical protein [Afipia sp.]
MNENVGRLHEQIKTLQIELDAELAIIRNQLNYRLEGGRARFEEEMLRAHRALRIGVAKYVVNASPLVILTAPVIYSMIVPFALLDLFLTVYQLICFPIYGIERVKRSDYFIFDRAHLAYLNIVEKINCAYCSYGNGLMAYASEIAGRTEQYWCPIKHARKAISTHEHYSQFAEFGDAKSFRKKYGNVD